MHRMKYVGCIVNVIRNVPADPIETPPTVLLPITIGQIRLGLNPCFSKPVSWLLNAFALLVHMTEAC